MKKEEIETLKSTDFLKKNNYNLFDNYFATNKKTSDYSLVLVFIIFFYCF